jgi:hypothetical protein
MRQKSLAAEARLEELRSWPAKAPVRSKIAIPENKKLHLEGGVRSVTYIGRLRVKSKLELSTFRGQFCLSAHFLGRRLKSAQTADLFHNALGVELVFQPFERSVDRLTFSHNYFGHKNSDLTNAFSNEG